MGWRAAGCRAWRTRGTSWPPYLLPGETLLWTGRPDPAKHVSASDVFLVPFSLLWGGFAIFWLITVLVEGAPVPFALFGVPFVAVGLYFIFGRFIYKAYRKRQTVYGLTEGRALVAVGSGSLSEAPLQQTPMDRRRSRDGRHLTVTFGRSAGGWFGATYANTGMDFFDRGNGPVGFYDVTDVTGLETALRPRAALTSTTANRAPATVHYPCLAAPLECPCVSAVRASLPRRQADRLTGGSARPPDPQ